jgi:hypothetical protein
MSTKSLKHYENIPQGDRSQGGTCNASTVTVSSHRLTARSGNPAGTGMGRYADATGPFDSSIDEAGDRFVSYVGDDDLGMMSRRRAVPVIEHGTFSQHLGRHVVKPTTWISVLFLFLCLAGIAYCVIMFNDALSGPGLSADAAKLIGM